MRQTKSKVLFLDETNLRLSAAPHSTLVAPGETNYVVVDDTSSYAARYDMIACCSGDTVFPPIIFSSEDRAAWGQAGINTDMLIFHVEQLLARALGALDLSPLTLVIDRSRIHNVDKMMEAFHENGCQELQTIYLMPPDAAKRMSPLDNALVNQWKEAIDKRGKLTKKNIIQIMSEEWNKIPTSSLRAHSRNCGLMHGIDPYFDCPVPSSHRHHGA